MEWKMEQVPPPAEVNEQPTAASLGLVRGLRVEKNYSQYRCANCSKMQPNGSILVWVSDGIRTSDPGWAITENERAKAYNGSGSGWCLRCAQRLGQPWWKFW